MSNLHSVYFGLWQVPADSGQPKTLVDGDEGGFLGQHEPPIMGSVGRTDALIEFTRLSFDADVHSFQAVRHYAVRDGVAARIDPIALDPRAFIEEWLSAEWRESKGWTDPAALAAAEPLYRRMRRSDGSLLGNRFVDNGKRCSADRSLWQVGISGEVDGHPSADSWFLVRWEPPYVFRLVAVTTSPRADCVIDEPIDGDLGTLFPIQDWRE